MAKCSRCANEAREGRRTRGRVLDVRRDEAARDGLMAICICGPEWRNPNCDLHGNAQQECVQAPPPPRKPCPSGTRGCGQIAARPGRWWYCSTECRALNKDRP